MNTNTIEFNFLFLADEHEEECKAILRREIVNIIKDNIVPRIGIDMDDIEEWSAVTGPVQFHSSVSGFQYEVTVTIKLNAEIEQAQADKVGYINHRWGGH